MEYTISKRARDAADKVLRNPLSSKKAKVARGESLTQRPLKVPVRPRRKQDRGQST